NDVGTMKVTQKLTGKKKRLVTSKVIANTFVDFIIVPSKGVQNLYTIKLKKFYFHERKHTMCRSTRDVRRHIFQGFENLKLEFQQENNAIIESMVGVGEKKSKKRERESSISDRESAIKTHKRNEHNNHDTSETENFLDDAWNNLMNWDAIHKNEVTHVKASIR
ncbi:hypothetical protein H5410_002552, partial [Solanum commersonii]